MNKDILEGNWQQFKGKVKEQWGKFTAEQLTTFTSPTTDKRLLPLSPREKEMHKATWHLRLQLRIPG